MSRTRSVALSIALVLAACSGRSVSPAPPAAPANPALPIRHVVWIMQENRSFDNLFQGFPGADTSATGVDLEGHTVALRSVPFAGGYDIDHSSTAYFTACNGEGVPRGTACRMNGFDHEVTDCTATCPPHPQYAYVPHSQTRLYFEMARRYVLGDRAFASNIDLSYVSHQYMIAGQAAGAVDFPIARWGCEGNFDSIETLRGNRSYGPFIPVCQNYRTLADELEEAGLSWRMYAASKESQWIAFASIRHIRYGPAWNRNVVGSSAQVIDDVRRGRLAAVTWVTPTCEHSDHAACNSATGPAWVAHVVDAIGESKFWNSTAIFVMWDEWGGWYDHVAPPFEDYDGLGFRVPLLVISPYAKRGYVSHVQYEHGSILRFIEDRFGLARLASSDARANSPLSDCFDFTQTPRRFRPFLPPLSDADVRRMEREEKPEPPDDQ